MVRKTLMTVACIAALGLVMAGPALAAFDDDPSALAPICSADELVAVTGLDAVAPVCQAIEIAPLDDAELFAVLDERPPVRMAPGQSPLILALKQGTAISQVIGLCTPDLRCRSPG